MRYGIIDMNTYNKNKKKIFLVNLFLAIAVGFILLAQATNVSASEENVGQYALIERATGKVVNVILLDPSSRWTAPEGHIVIRSDVAGPGDMWDRRGEFKKQDPAKASTPTPTPVQADGNDVAELMEVMENSILPGDMVAVSEQGLTLRKTNKSYDRNIVGVVSTNPGVLLGRVENGMSVPVALSGRVLLKVSVENGPIAPGDAITSSSTPGVGMRATKPGRVVGIALEAYEGLQINGTQLNKPITVLINPHWQGNEKLLALDGNNNLGIGTTTPSFRLDVADMQIASPVARIFNTSVSTDADGLVIKLGNVSTTAVAATNHFLSFETSGIGIVGSISGNGGKGVTYATSGVADFAEYFRKDPNQNVQFGSVMCLNESGFAVLCNSLNSKILGIASERPAFLGGENLGDGSIAVGLVGQVRTRVSAVNGAIQIGDPLTSSSVPGIAVKATSVGQILGKALEPFDGAQGEEGEILVSVNITWYNPSVYVAMDGTLSGITATVSGIEEQLALQGDLLASQGQALQAQIASASASLAAQIASNATAANYVLASDPLFDSLNNKVSSLESKLDLLSLQFEQQASISALLSQISTGGQVLGASTSAALALGDLELNNATIAQDLMVLGHTTVTTLGVTGNINAGLLSIHGLDGEINTLSGALYLQKTGLGGVDILAGKVVIDTVGNMIVAGTITADSIEANNYTVLGQESIGSGTIPTGATSIEVSTAIASSSSKIFLTTTSLTDRQITVIEKQNGKFKVAIPASTTSPISFDWWIVGTK